ncbi:photosystem reaction center subunit H [Leptolyngbya sp. 'hensonii']|uniref:PRC-barrel domain-containing protein n=1 Tax=Leptolyngbya sp. 'hensonii' TaxID=1922337 RepID=UPI000950245F|nr:PRC-barrel domain-containing protein [Leptolyngbya sp. 'hensonii']OLP17535.1 photosystem reaction center subunit H [Leptolyngbya sp. 'hensonii']
MTSDKIWQRSDLLGTQVITRDTGKRLGVVSQLWVDVDQREVVVLSLRENLLSGLVSGVPKFMLLSSIRQIGDVILVDTEDAIEDVNVDVYNSLTNSEVITETGEPLGRVRGFRFDVENGKLASLIIAQLGLPLIPDQVISTYELPVEEIVSSGPDRLIVFEGAEDRLNQLTVGILERVGIGRPPWERDEDELPYAPTTPVDRQLPAPQKVASQPPMRATRPAVEETWDDDHWEQPGAAPPKRMMRQQQPQPNYYEEDSNWSPATNRDSYPQEEYDEDDYDEAYEDDYDEDYENNPIVKSSFDESVEEDVWGSEAESRQPLKIPEKKKAPEYEEEGY